MAMLRVCDSCKKPDRPAAEISVPVGYSPDPAEGRSTEDFDRVDLCAPCGSMVLKTVLYDIFTGFGRSGPGPYNKALANGIRAGDFKR